MDLVEITKHGAFPFIPALFLLSINKLPVLLLIGLNIVVSAVQVVTVPLAPSSLYDCGIFHCWSPCFVCRHNTLGARTFCFSLQHLEVVFILF